MLATGIGRTVECTVYIGQTRLGLLAIMRLTKTVERIVTVAAAGAALRHRARRAIGGCDPPHPASIAAATQLLSA